MVFPTRKQTRSYTFCPSCNTPARVPYNPTISVGIFVNRARPKECAEWSVHCRWVSTNWKRWRGKLALISSKGGFGCRLMYTTVILHINTAGLVIRGNSTETKTRHWGYRSWFLGTIAVTWVCSTAGGAERTWECGVVTGHLVLHLFIRGRCFTGLDIGKGLRWRVRGRRTIVWWRTGHTNWKGILWKGVIIVVIVMVVPGCIQPLKKRKKFYWDKKNDKYLFINICLYITKIHYFCNKFNTAKPTRHGKIFIRAIHLKCSDLESRKAISILIKDNLCNLQLYIPFFYHSNSW